MPIAWSFFPKLNVLKTVWRWPQGHSRDRWHSLGQHYERTLLTNEIYYINRSTISNELL